MDVERNIYRILRKKDIPFKASEHEPVYTSEQAARVRGAALQSGVKAMVLRVDDERYVLALVPGDQRVDLTKIAELESAREVRLAKPEEVLQVTGCVVGAVPPFGHATQLKTYMDRAILQNEWVNFNAGKHTKSVSMKAADLAECVAPIMI